MTDPRPERLYVYECRGPRFPQSEPDCEGLLGIWPESQFHYFFYDREVSPAVGRWLAMQNGWTLENTYQLDYSQWQQVTACDHRVGPFVISSVGQSAATGEKPQEIRIKMNPGVVFGSGLHPSTTGCLLAIADLIPRFSIKSVVDLGTGTGILALACARLGVPKAWALDCNALAAKIAQQNVRTNGLEHRVRVIAAQELTVLRQHSDLLLMNLEWPCLQRVLRGPDWLAYRWVVLSGFLESQWDQLSALMPASFVVLARQVLDDWLTVVISRPDELAGRNPE